MAPFIPASVGTPTNLTLCGYPYIANNSWTQLCWSWSIHACTYIYIYIYGHKKAKYTTHRQLTGSAKHQVWLCEARLRYKTHLEQGLVLSKYFQLTTLQSDLNTQIRNSNLNVVWGPIMYFPGILELICMNHCSKWPVVYSHWLLLLPLSSPSVWEKLL